TASASPGRGGLTANRAPCAAIPSYQTKCARALSRNDKWRSWTPNRLGELRIVDRIVNPLETDGFAAQQPIQKHQVLFGPSETLSRRPLAKPKDTASGRAAPD